MECAIYTDDTVLTTGQYKLTALCRVPPKYLLSLYTNYNKRRLVEKPLLAYIEQHLDIIKGRNDGTIPIPPIENLCGKACYFSKKEAKTHLKNIRVLKQVQKKPVRAYECEKCSGWHLTSIPYDVWKERLAQYKKDAHTTKPIK